MVAEAILSSLYALWSKVDLENDGRQQRFESVCKVTKEMIAPLPEIVKSRLFKAFKDAGWEAQLNTTDKVGSIGQSLWSPSITRLKQKKLIEELFRAQKYLMNI